MYAEVTLDLIFSHTNFYMNKNVNTNICMKTIQWCKLWYHFPVVIQSYFGIATNGNAGEQEGKGCRRSRGFSTTLNNLLFFFVIGLQPAASHVPARECQPRGF